MLEVELRVCLFFSTLYQRCSHLMKKKEKHKKKCPQATLNVSICTLAALDPITGLPVPLRPSAAANTRSTELLLFAFALGIVLNVYENVLPETLNILPPLPNCRSSDRRWSGGSGNTTEILAAPGFICSLARTQPS